jgi:ribosomal protein S20
LLALFSENISEKTLKDVKINIKRNLENHSFDEKLRNRSKQIIFKVY